MAKILPSGWRELAVTGAAQREIETLATLEAGVDDHCTILHGVHWTRVETAGALGYSVYGEIDFVVVGPGGAVLLIEQKSGFLDETDTGLVKRYAGREKNVPAQMQRSVQALRGKLARAGLDTRVEYLLYCPDHRVRAPERAGLDAARIVDAPARDSLAARVAALVATTAREEAASAATRADLAERVRRFFSDELQLSPDPSAMLGQAETLVTRVSGGLATWARRIETSPARLRVIGTAGSGKTQLALALYRDALAAGRRPLYVCFNRPLADHVERLAGAGGQVVTFHRLCDSVARARGLTPDYAQAEAWRQIEAVLADGPVPEAWRTDMLIVDEGQDFNQAWAESLFRLVGDDGRVVWLEDPLQNLYGRPPVALPGWTVLRAPSNFRSPRRVVALLRALLASLADAAALATAQEIEAASPFLGADIDVFEYADGDADAMREASKLAITRCLGAGFARKDIALLSFHGREHSALLDLDRLGPHALRAFTGQYDLFGNPVYRDGEVLAESVYRFKGQSAPAVVLSEIDFAALDAAARRKLFVGLTRARLRIALVASRRAAQALAETIAASEG